MRMIYMMTGTDNEFNHPAGDCGVDFSSSTSSEDEMCIDEQHELADKVIEKTFERNDLDLELKFLKRELIPYAKNGICRPTAKISYFPAVVAESISQKRLRRYLDKNMGWSESDINRLVDNCAEKKARRESLRIHPVRK